MCRHEGLFVLGDLIMSCDCDFGAGLRICHCAGCHETFTSVSAFDLHQRIDDGEEVCINPELLRKRDGDKVLAECRKTPDGRAVWGVCRPDLPKRTFPPRQRVSVS